jgi:hypothetical protein
MFRKWKKQDVPVTEPADAIDTLDLCDTVEPIDLAKVEPASFDSLPYIDNETLEQFLADPDSVELLPVDPSDYRRELQRLIVSAFLHDASIHAKQVELA